MKHSPNRIIINSSALQSNYKLLNSKVQTTCQTAAVIKANGYGLGIDVVVPELEQAGARFFYVAHFAEAMAVRELTSAPIAVLSGLPRGAADDYKHNRIVPVLNSMEDIDYCPADLPAIWHIDTGMNRSGLSVDDVSHLAGHAKSLPLLMMTHFTSSDEAHSPHSAEQVRQFDECIAGLPQPFQMIPHSLCNSSGIFRNEDWHRSQVRPGLALYGANPTPELHNPMARVVDMETRILQIRRAKAGETVGYNQTETLEKDTILATVGLGYADGFLRSGSSRAKLYWHGQPCKVMGRVSMDLIVVDIGNLKDCPAIIQGNWLEVLGEHQSVDQLAADLGTISYEVLTSLSRRAERLVR
ncbi:MAG TPA: alanine racemase [Rhodospirillaceae bacterium]|nr:alanine racemase [Rhodospirillaceae bacterium]